MSTGSGTGTPINIATSTDYCTLAQLKSELSITDSTDDTRLSLCITAASRAIEQTTGRFFYQRSSETRYFDAANQNVCYLDDFVSVSAIQTDEDGDGVFENTWATTDYVIGPYNVTLQAEQEPYQFIARTRAGSYYFPYGTLTGTYLLGAAGFDAYTLNSQKAVKVTGVWGWPSVPNDIVKACLMQASRFYKRADAIFGVAGTSAFGTLNLTLPVDPDIAMLLANRRRNWFG